MSDYFAYTNAQDENKDHPGVTEEAQNVFEKADQAPLMFIPKSGITPTFRITVDYIVRTYDEALKTKYTEVEQIISKSGAAQLLIKHCHEFLPVSRNNVLQVKETIKKL